MTAKTLGKRPYDRLIIGVRHRASGVKKRTLEEEADSDRGRVLFSAPFRRLQNKAQVFSLESNAAVRSRLTHSLEVSSIGRFVAQQAIAAFGSNERNALGIAGKERPLITFVETACLLHDLGNPPFGHFGEIAISDWFHSNEGFLRPGTIGGAPRREWEKFYADFRHFDGNPQGLRISTKLQPSKPNDLCGLNLTATTIAATLKYPWTTEWVGKKLPGGTDDCKKAGYFQTEKEVVDWICANLSLDPGTRHPLVYLMEAADDIAYCLSDIEDGIEKGLISGPQFGDYMMKMLRRSKLFSKAKGKDRSDVTAISLALIGLKKLAPEVSGVSVEQVTTMHDFRSAVIRLLVRHASCMFRDNQDSILKGSAGALLRNCGAWPVLKALNDFAVSHLYSSMIVRNREITAQAVISGLLDAYRPLMKCDRSRFKKALDGQRRDDGGRPIGRDSSLIRRVSRKFLGVYNESVRKMEQQLKGDTGAINVMERIHRMRLIVDHVSGMTDEFALQTYQLISGTQISPYRN